MYFPFFQDIVSVFQIMKYSHCSFLISCFALFPELTVHPPNIMMSLPEIFKVCPYLASGGSFEILNLDQVKVSVSRTLMSFK